MTSVHFTHAVFEPVALPLHRLPKQTLHHVWAPIHRRPVLLTSQGQLHLWVMLELEHLSVWMWMRIALFMQAKSAYLLRGVMVNPPDLANARRAKTENSCIFTSINFQTLDFK